MKNIVLPYLVFLGACFAGGYVNASDMTMHSIEIVEQSLHKLTWKAPNERTNGDPLPPEEIVGYKVERINDAGSVLETVELGSDTLELAITLIPNECMVYKAYAIATDGSPPSENMESGTLTSEPTDAIRICVVPPRKPRDFQVQ